MAPPIRSASALCRRAESKFACAFLRRRAESPGKTTATTTTAQQRGYVAESIIKYYAYFASSNIAFFLPSSAFVCVCLQSLFYLMHKSAGKIYKNFPAREGQGVGIQFV